MLLLHNDLIQMGHRKTWLEVDKQEFTLASWSLAHPGHQGGWEKHKNALPVGRKAGEMFKMTKTV